MPINTLQPRLRKLGRIRIGARETFTRKDGKQGSRPAKLDAFRFTSHDGQLVAAVAELYGGTPQPWAGGEGDQHEVYTSASDPRSDVA